MRSMRRWWSAPTEQTMGNVQRIFYYHVPSAWTAFLLFFINFVCSIQYLVRSQPGRRQGGELDRDRDRRCCLHRCLRDSSAAGRAWSRRRSPRPGSPSPACIS